MKYLPLFLIMLVILSNFGCTNRNDEMPYPYSDYETGTTKWKKWEEGIDDVIDIVTQSDSDVLLTDYGEPLPYDVYKECCYYHGHKPLCKVSMSQIMGEWEFRDRDIDLFLKLTCEGDYSIINEDDSPERKICYHKIGKFTYDSVFNRITLLDFYTSEELTPSDYIEYKDPQNKDFIITDISDYSMDLFVSGAYTYYFYKRNIVDIF